MNKAVEIKLVKLNSHARIPKRMSDGAAGFDLFYCGSDDIALEPMDKHDMPTGISIALPQSHYAQVVSRSGLAFKHGIIVLNSPGIIDSDYRGEIKVCLFNLSKETFMFKQHNRIAQLIITPNFYDNVSFIEASGMDSTKRGDGCLGSTGI